MNSSPQKAVMKKPGDIVERKLSNVLTEIYNDDLLFYSAEMIRELPQIQAENPNVSERMALNMWADAQSRKAG